MSNEFVIEELRKKRNEMIAERDALFHHQTKNIEAIENSIEMLSGKKIWEIEKEERFDDENPNYIKGSFEE